MQKSQTTAEKVSKSHRDRQGPIGPGELVPEVVVGGELDGLLGGDQQDVHTAAPVHTKVALKKKVLDWFVCHLARCQIAKSKLDFGIKANLSLFVCFYSNLNTSAL